MSNTTRGAELRRLRREMLAVDDARLRQIVQVVDALPARGEADSLIAPLRPRLALLKPPRPLTLARLLFLPLDPLIVDPRLWRAGELGIPRTVLLSLAGAVAAGLGPQTAEVEARIAGHAAADLDVVMEAGAMLWPAAAAALRVAKPPADWLEVTGLRPAGFEPIARPVGALLAHGPALFALALGNGEPPDPHGAEALLAAAAQDGPEALAMMLALLLARLREPGPLMLLAEDLAKRGPEGARGAPDRALDFLLAGLDTADPAADDVSLGVDAMCRAAVLLEGIESHPVQRPLRVAKLERVRRRLDSICRGRVEATAAALGPPVSPPGAPAAPASDGEVNELEAAALELRRMEAVGRRLGGPGFYDAALRRTAERLVAAPGLTGMDRLRIAEILLGTDAALELIERGPARPGR